MSCSLDDVNLIIVHNGQKRYWAGVKTCGHVLMDERLGLWADSPEPDLSWISKSTWGEMLEEIESPLQDPVYGSITVDFDAKQIIDRSGFGHFFDMNLSWLAMTWRFPREAPVTKKSLRGHLRAGRVQLIDSCDLRDACPVGEVFPTTVPKAQVFVEQKLDIGCWHARFKLPDGWAYTAEDDDDTVNG